MSTNTGFEFIQWLNKYRISSNNNRPSMTSINRLPRIIACTWKDVPPEKSLPIYPEGGGTSVHRLSNNHPPVTDIFKWIQFNPSKCNGGSGSIIDQWRFKLWKVIKELNWEHLNFLFSVYLMRLFFLFIYLGNKTKYLGHDFQWAIFEIITFLE